MNVSSKKTEKKAINKIEDLLDELEHFDYDFKADDTGISWDGHIDLYHGNIDDKENFDTRIATQIKGRSTNNKKLENKWKFNIDKRDIENYGKIDGTLFLAVRFLKNGEYKIYYKSLLPKNISDLLKEPTNSKNELKITLREIKDKFHLERICRDFFVDRETQKKLSKDIFNCSAVSIENNGTGTISTWNSKNFNLLNILGEEKFIYFLDESQTIINVECAEITRVVEGLDIDVTSKNGKLYYTIINHSTELNGNKTISFGKAFTLTYSPQIFYIKLSGTLKERIKQLEFILDTVENNGFIIGSKAITLNMDESEIEKYTKLYETYIKVLEFCEKHNIKKDINLDNWNNKDFHKFLIWIDAIDKKQKIYIKEWNSSMLGSIQVNEVRFSIFAEELTDGSYRIYSIWNDDSKNHYQFRYESDDTDAIYTNNFFSILNKDVYLSDDIDVVEMKNFYNSNELQENEEILLNLQVLEIIKAFDINGKTELLDYAKYLLEKISIYDSVYDVARINYLQIEKRLRNLTENELEELISIRNKNQDKLFNISINLLIGNKNEAKIELKKLSNIEREIFLQYPIAIFLK